MSAKETIQTAAEPIRRPFNEAETSKLWHKYSTLLRVDSRNKRQEDELFLLRQQLGIPDRHHEIYQLAVEAEKPILNAEEQCAAANQAMADAYKARDAMRARHQKSHVRAREETRVANEQCQKAGCAYAGAIVQAQHLAGLRARFWRLFDGSAPGSDQTTLPPDLSNAIGSLGFDRDTLQRHLPACK